MNKNDITIKLATWEDYGYCYRLTKKNMIKSFTKYWGGWKSKVFRENFDPKDTKIILKNHRRVGYIALKKKSNCYHIDNIQLSPQVHGKGIGSSLLNYIEKQVQKSNLKKIQLTVFKDNPAKSLYERQGYKIVADKETAVLMEKRI